MLFILKREGVTTTAFSLSYTPPPPFLSLCCFVCCSVCVCVCVLVGDEERIQYKNHPFEIRVSEFHYQTTKHIC